MPVVTRTPAAQKLLKVKAPPLPKTLGAAIDLLKKLRDERKAADAVAAAKKEVESAIEDAIFARFAKAELDGARGRTAQAAIVRTEVPTIKDYDAVAAFVLKERVPELFQRRLSTETVRALWANGTTVPGIDKYVAVRLSLTAVKRSAP